ncbi:hypothetical protein D3C77_642950 [compost metagenome]
MQRAPNDEVEARPVPQAGNQHGQEHVQIAAPYAATIATQGDVHVITNEQRQADMPACPELLEVVSGIGGIEVIGQTKAQ